MKDVMLVNEREVNFLYRTNGVIGGVFSGLADLTNKSPNLLRFLYLVTFFYFGAGLILYPLCWWIFPKKQNLATATRPFFFGVAGNIAHKWKVDVSIVRLTMLLLFIASFGTMTLLYLLLAVFQSQKTKNN
jgi:phage shock protein PspC (stress-responsive transcriptional regulator)